MRSSALLLLAATLASTPLPGQERTSPRPRVRDLGIEIGVFPPGPRNAITDVGEIRVGHVTLIRGDSVRTGVTAIIPHGRNIFREKVPAAIEVGNGFGKLIGATQVQELGLLETPIVLTNTLSVWDAANGVVDYMLGLPGNGDIRSINPVVGETNDGTLNDIRGRHVRREDAVKAIVEAQRGPVQEGCVGAGTGTVCFGWKGGIGTSSRVLPDGLLVGVLVQTNFGGLFDLDGVPVGKELGRSGPAGRRDSTAGGSCMIVVATSAPLDSRLLQRLAKRATLALGRTGSSMSHGSGDYVIAFSTSRPAAEKESSGVSDERISALFQAVVEATEEAIDNSLFKATDMKGRLGRTVEALPLEKVKQLLRRYGRLR